MEVGMDGVLGQSVLSRVKVEFILGIETVTTRNYKMAVNHARERGSRRSRVTRRNAQVSHLIYFDLFPNSIPIPHV